MVVFWSLAALMVLAALAFILVPLLRARPSDAPTVVEANLEVLRGQRREIEADVANGVLPADAKDEALAELVDRAQGDLAAPADAPAAPRRPWLAAAVASIAVPAIAFGMYLAVGTPDAADSAKVGHEGAPMNRQQIVAMVDNLSKKVHERPDDVQGWALLARSMAALGRFPEATEAYEHLMKLTPDDPQVLADYADALGMAQGRSLAGRPTELVRKALAMDPHQPKALALAGTAALDTGDFRQALRYWETLAGDLPAGSEDRTRVEAIIGEVRERATDAGKPLPAAATASVSAPPAPGASVTGSVSLAPALAGRLDRAATLFVFARAENGSRIPLAVVKAPAALPMEFTLDDSQAMAPSMKLSGAKAVRIEARVSRSGNALPQPGDLTGTSGVVKPGARGVKVVIDSVVGGASATAAPAAPASATADPGAVTGSVTVAPQVASKVDGAATLFVFARAENGPRMPLAIVRAAARELPLHFKLDDSQAMAPTMKLSGAPAVRIEARISRSGNATPQSGDLVGTSGVVKPGARDVNVVVDKVVP
ncbi:MAG TPA: c-type cytochrome biogenesis protein CcmI [Usitatibacter sp.]|jgi:cytochrome c-type biogenesis protein CcmH|nr:c-type cytochrome biogenesis protein CcmI [Usitatibacter sp.]